MSVLCLFYNGRLKDTLDEGSQPMSCQLLPPSVHHQLPVQLHNVGQVHVLIALRSDLQLAGCNGEHMLAVFVHKHFELDQVLQDGNVIELSIVEYNV